MEITVTITAPGLERAIEALATAVGGTMALQSQFSAGPSAPAASMPSQSSPPASTPTAPAVPTAQASTQVPTAPETQYTMEQLAVAATQLMDSGRQADLVGLLNNFGVQALTALPKEQYGAFATQLRAMGARI